jgi:ABC-2 type transport system ATP-binding protein
MREEGSVQRDARTTEPSASNAVVDVHDILMTFGDVTALAGLSLDVRPGTILGVIGPSGAGKTTLVRLLTGAIKPGRGRIRVFGEDPRKFRRQTRERIGYMPQLFTLYRDLTAGENVDFVASLYGLLWWRRRRRVREVLGLVELWDARKRRASQLSGGMQRRLELACALVHEPALLFLDEPTGGIDPILRGRIWEELHRLRDAGRTLIVTTQYVTEAEECDSVALVAEGRLIAHDAPDDLRRGAVGGDLIDIEMAGDVDLAAFESIKVIKGLRQLDRRTVRATVDDGATATPAIVDAITSAGGEVRATSTAQPSFDEVFAILVERHRSKIRTIEEAAARQRRPEAA